MRVPVFTRIVTALLDRLLQLLLLPLLALLALVHIPPAPLLSPEPAASTPTPQVRVASAALTSPDQATRAAPLVVQPVSNAPVTSAQAALAAPNAQVVDPLPGFYSPNTTIEMRGSELWFVRPPYESLLVPAGDGMYLFTSGWLSDRLAHFATNNVGGISIMLLGDDGTWHEFARSGTVYPNFNRDLADHLSLLLEQVTERPAVPGAILYVHIPGEGEWAGARGVSNQSLGIPMVPNDRFRIASVTKTWVATVMLQLAEEGYLSLDDTMHHWMPGLVPNGENITIRHLLNHTSGLRNYLEGGFVDSFMADRSRFWSQHELATYGVTQPPYFAPGEPGRWRYSNTNYVLLGMVVEHATGTSLGQQVRWRIIEPLGLHNTFFEPYEAGPSDIVRGYVGNEDMTDVNMSVVWGAGGITSSADDTGRFLQALVNGQLLSPESMHAMHSFVGLDHSWGSGARNAVYGLGIVQDRMGINNTAANGQPRAATAGVVRGHTGGLAGYRTAMWYLPESGVTIVVAHNQMFFDPNIIATAAMNIILAHLETNAQPAHAAHVAPGTE